MDAVKEIVERLQELYNDETPLGQPQFRPESGYDNLPLEVENFVPLGDPITDNLPQIACIDGGNVELAGAPNFSIQLNRIFFNIFQGSKRILTDIIPHRLEYLSITKAINTDEGIFYNTFILPLDDRFADLLPENKDLEINSQDRNVAPQGFRASISRFASIARRFAEWKMARILCERVLKPKDIVIMDGTLSANNPNEHKYAEETVKSADENGVILTGLAKTCRIYTSSGKPLISAVSTLAEQVPYKTWYIPVAKCTSNFHLANIYVIKLHPIGKTPYRFEINVHQASKMTIGEITSLITVIAQNSCDLSFPGYPYGLIDADFQARVSYSEVPTYRTLLDAEISKHPELAKMVAKDLSAVESHVDLNNLRDFHE